MNEVINYVMDTPGNTNPNVLKGLLNKVDSGGPGYTTEETRTVVIPEQTVTTVDDGDFIAALLTVADGVTANFNVGDTLSFTINGETKSIDAERFDGLPEDAVAFVFSGSYGEPQNPGIFVIGQDDGMGMITTRLPEATYTVKAELVTRTIATTPDFDAAVAKSTEPLVLTLVPTNPSNPFQGGTYTGATPEEVVAARRSGRAIRASLGERAFDVTGESESALIGQFLYQIASTIFFVQVTISKVDTVYAAHGFTGLQVPD